ncbi:hypothetical protein NMY22_g8669 [Coprinellus aureogranulatus]|nr:hypothetical protein NMY22_g8669 [Coprinellus aureogranulatus]
MTLLATWTVLMGPRAPSTPEAMQVEGVRGELEDLQVPCDPALLDVASRWKTELGKDLFAQPTRSLPDVSFTVRRRLELKLLLREIASYDLQGRDSRVLIWLGIPALLARVGWDAEGGAIQREPLNTYRQKAQDILNKWRTSLLVDFRRSSPFRWCFIGDDTSRVKFIEQETLSFRANDEWVTSVSDRPEDLDWERITGRGDIDEWAAARKGPAWFTE